MEILKAYQPNALPSTPEASVASEPEPDTVAEPVIELESRDSGSDMVPTPDEGLSKPDEEGIPRLEGERDKTYWERVNKAHESAIKIQL
ncbi:MAG TPA: hypothetical protein VJ854_03225 [Sphaerochaeta sp.]|nr:hypothetical protein [Sphaerochaeta sp.]